MLSAFDEDERRRRRLTAEAMRMGIEGSPAGGARTAAARRAAAEAGLASTAAVDRAQAELGLLGTERELGSLEDDRMMKLMKLEGWIMSLKEAGYGGVKLKEAVLAAAAQQTDPDIKLYLEQRVS